MRKAIVTGANGFIGTWLLQTLSRNEVETYAVVQNEASVINRIDKLPHVKIIYCDLCDITNLFNMIEDRDIDVFYHLAWAGSTGAERSDYELQMKNTIYACDAANTAKKLMVKKFLCAGTITENIVDGIFKMNAISQNMIYGIAKKTTHELLEVLCNRLGLDFVWMQFSNVYGPYNNSGNLLSYTLDELLNNRVPEFSKGIQPYDFIYVEDLVKAIYLLGFSATNNKLYFIGSGSKRLLKDYLEEIPSIIEKGSVSLGKRPEDGILYKNEWFDITDLKEDVGFQAEYTFQKGVKETWKWLLKEMELEYDTEI